MLIIEAGVAVVQRAATAIITTLSAANPAGWTDTEIAVTTLVFGLALLGGIVAWWIRRHPKPRPARATIPAQRRPGDRERVR